MLGVLGHQIGKRLGLQKPAYKGILRTEGDDINKESLVLGTECMPGTVKNIYHTFSLLFMFTNIPLYTIGLQRSGHKQKRESNLTKVSTAKSWTEVYL